ncbi:MAG: NADH-quinone oxidoreductase subunit L [Phycisphaerales bacterium]
MPLTLFNSTLAAASVQEGAAATLLVPILTAGASILCGVFAILRNRSKLPAFASVLLLAASFLAILYTYLQQGPAGAPAIAHGFDWFNLAAAAPSDAGEAPLRLLAAFSFYIDSLTLLWMLFVTGLATLIALYASEYMSHDVGPGYCRFFAAFTLFVFSMSCLVMADNLVLLYLGWEGVGLCSYLLIGYFYKKPSAVAAAKKAFIVNRIGDLGLALGIWLTFVQFGSVQYADLFSHPDLLKAIEHARAGNWGLIPWTVQAIPLLFMIGAFGKSAQLPLYVWLPDAMEGPTPVSALIHAATMVTAGVYLVARTLPFFVCSEYALPIVAWVGSLTALLAATIGMAQFDIKRIMAYSTVSQLGYMFAGLGVLTAAGSPEAAAAGPYHVFTHAFFKALLFLSCGAVMHGFAGQLDLRKLSGVLYMPGWTIVGVGMLVGCLNLAGFPLITAGFFSKDMILAEAFVNPHTQIIGWILLFTAGLTAYYTFRVFFRVFMGPKLYEPGDELHAHDDHAHDSHGHDSHGEHGTPADPHPAHAAHDFQPHPPGWAINTVLAVLALACFAAIAPYFTHWVPGLIEHSSTGLAFGSHAETPAADHAHDPHAVMYYVSAVVGFLGIAVAAWLHLLGRTSAATSRADSLLPTLGPIATAAQHKWYVDEFYEALIRLPLWVLSHVFHLIDKLIVDGLVNLFGMTPRLTGWSLRPSQSGVMHAYAAGMAAGLALIVLIAVMMVQ